LPTAPAAAFERQTAAPSLSQQPSLSQYSSTASFDVVAVPDKPPFVAHVGNLSYNVTEHDLETFFGESKVILFHKFI
jgi:hypothetical protein